MADPKIINILMSLRWAELCVAVLLLVLGYLTYRRYYDSDRAKASSMGRVRLW